MLSAAVQAARRVAERRRRSERRACEVARQQRWAHAARVWRGRGSGGRPRARAAETAGTAVSPAPPHPRNAVRCAAAARTSRTVCPVRPPLRWQRAVGPCPRSNTSQSNWFARAGTRQRAGCATAAALDSGCGCAAAHQSQPRSRRRSVPGRTVRSTACGARGVCLWRPSARQKRHPRGADRLLRHQPRSLEGVQAEERRTL